ncbi:MAG: dTDP-4-dehydrorhamnose reductase [Terriglobia bacterium]
MKVLITGANGQLGRALQMMQPAQAEVVAFMRDALDITDRAAVTQAIARNRPDWVINAAAYNAVDAAETEREAAFAVNAHGPRFLAEALARHGGRLIHVSTDFVFTGDQTRAYRPEDPVAPLGAYGESKAAGEAAVREVLPDHHLLMRTAWVYDGEGHNFVSTMLALMRQRREINVVDDQIGTPTRACGLAFALWTAIAKNLSGTHHWTDAGVASRYDFACAIYAIGRGIGRVSAPVVIRPVPSSSFPTPARRPAFSVLDKTATWAALEATPVHWCDALRLALADGRI